MTRPLAITEKQARTLIRAAEKEKAVIEVKVGDPGRTAIKWRKAEMF